jgi:hypothetical protein
MSSLATKSSNPKGQVLIGTDFTSNDVNFGAPRINTNNGKNVPIYNAHARGLLHISTPLMMTWGLNENDYDGSGKVSYDISFQFPSSDYMTEEAESFLSNLKDLEQKVKDTAVKNCKEWFNKNSMSPEVVDALWTPMLRYPKDKDTGEIDTTRAPSVRVKVPYWEQEFKTEIFDTELTQLFPDPDNNTTPKELLPSKTLIASCWTSGGIWFANGKFGMTWKLKQAIIRPPRSSGLQQGICHIQLSTSDKATLEGRNGDTEINNDNEVDAQQDVVVESDEEDIEEVNEKVEEEELVNEVSAKPAAAAPVKKRRIVRKKP